MWMILRIEYSVGVVHVVYMHLEYSLQFKCSIMVADIILDIFLDSLTPKLVYNNLN